MNACLKNRKLIAWLAVDALDADRARELRAHIETCEECRRYFTEISGITQNLSVAQIAPGIRASAAFHQQVVRSLQAEQRRPGWDALFAWLADWRVSVPAISTILVLLLAAFHHRHFEYPPANPVISTLASPPESQPTLSNFLWEANRSPEALDALLTKQAAINPMSAPIYTASALSLRDAPN
jgi:anti-sigma factor RsiW